MKKREELLEDYLDGKISNSSTLNELYNDSSFMKLLILKTRNPNYYNLCSDNLKRDIDFVLFLTRIFEDDLNLLFSMIYGYTRYCDERDPKYPELLYKINGYLKNFNNNFDITYFMLYKSKIIWFFEIKQDKINYFLEDQSEKYQKENSFGFSIMQYFYNDSKETQMFFAEHYLEKLFYEYDFENYIHKKYQSLDALNSVGINTVLSDYVKSFDEGLYEFVLVRPELLKSGEIKLLQIKDNFDEFALNDTRNKVDTFNTKLIDYLEEQDMLLDEKIDIIKLEEVKRLGLDKEFYGRELETLPFISSNGIVDFNLEKVRLYIRTELQNLFKNKVRKLDLNRKNDNK